MESDSSSQLLDKVLLLSLILGNTAIEETSQQEQQMQQRGGDSHSNGENASALPSQEVAQGSSNSQDQQVQAIDKSNTLMLLAQYLSEVGATQREHPTVQAILHTVEGAGATTGQPSHSQGVEGSTLDTVNKSSVVNRDGNNVESEEDTEPTVHPCRARGMPMAHNALTAYFVVSKHLEHGEGLRCTYPSCRDAGIKFRYCSFCNAPVAKRNFRKRHSHSSGTSDLVETPAEKTSQQPQSDLSSIQELPATSQPRGVVNDDAASKTPSSRVASVTDKDEGLSRVSDQTLTSSKAAARDSSGPDSSGGMAERESSTPSPNLEGTRNTRVISPTQLAAWGKLLDERPSFDEDPELIDAWISKVLEVSEPNPNK
eukprot:Nitzschia sp. Nitz4//scaffold8_size234185//44063//45461//NITZ4_001237-RA/size234185-snap-gene-0.5-mRNA-1//1//CDS//3329559746//832//frame0